MSKIKGVNLGEWLVLEKWMDPSVFEGTDAQDEDNLCRQLHGEEKLARFQRHRNTFITENDIAFIARCGLNAVRLPVPHFLLATTPVSAILMFHAFPMSTTVSLGVNVMVLKFSSTSIPLRIPRTDSTTVGFAGFRNGIRSGKISIGCWMSWRCLRTDMGNETRF